jgi:DNA-binding CsgD family transcriptional regulator
VVSGLSPKSIAVIHGVQSRGVENRISHLAAKLKAKDSEEMVSIAREHGLLED